MTEGAERAGSSGLESTAHAQLPVARTGHAALAQNHIAVFTIQKGNITQLSVGTNKLIAFNENNNLKELCLLTAKCSLASQWFCLQHWPQFSRGHD